MGNPVLLSLYSPGKPVLAAQPVFPRQACAPQPPDLLLYCRSGNGEAVTNICMGGGEGARKRRARCESHGMSGGGEPEAEGTEGVDDAIQWRRLHDLNRRLCPPPHPPAPCMSGGNRNFASWAGTRTRREYRKDTHSMFGKENSPRKREAWMENDPSPSSGPSQ